MGQGRRKQFPQGLREAALAWISGKGSQASCSSICGLAERVLGVTWGPALYHSQHAQHFQPA